MRSEEENEASCSLLSAPMDESHSSKASSFWDETASSSLMVWIWHTQHHLTQCIVVLGWDQPAGVNMLNSTDGQTQRDRMISNASTGLFGADG